MQMVREETNVPSSSKRSEVECRRIELRCAKEKMQATQEMQQTQHSKDPRGARIARRRPAPPQSCTQAEKAAAVGRTMARQGGINCTVVT